MGFKRGEYLCGKFFESKDLVKECQRDKFPDARIEHHPHNGWCLIRKGKPRFVGDWRKYPGGAICL